MDFARDSIDGVKATLVILFISIIASTIGAPIIPFEILLFGMGTVSIVIILSYILYIIYQGPARSDE
jgi:hypothetical protein